MGRQDAIDVTDFLILDEKRSGDGVYFFNCRQIAILEFRFCFVFC